MSWRSGRRLSAIAALAEALSGVTVVTTRQLPTTGTQSSTGSDAPSGPTWASSPHVHVHTDTDRQTDPETDPHDIKIKSNFYCILLMTRRVEWVTDISTSFFYLFLSTATSTIPTWKVPRIIQPHWNSNDEMDVIHWMNTRCLSLYIGPCIISSILMLKDVNTKERQYLYTSPAAQQELKTSSDWIW